MRFSIKLFIHINVFDFIKYNYCLVSYRLAKSSLVVYILFFPLIVKKDRTRDDYVDSIVLCEIPFFSI